MYNLLHSMVLCLVKSHKESGSDDPQVPFQLNYFIFVFLKAMTMLGFNNVSRVKKKKKDANGYSEDVQNYAL